MNFNQIKTNYPKAFEALREWYADRGNPATDDQGRMALMRAGQYLPFYLRDLYDFFDQEGVVIFMTYSTMDGNVFYCHVFRPDDRWNTQRVSGSTRTDAETAAFTKAFEILENQLLDA